MTDERVGRLQGLRQKAADGWHPRKGRQVNDPQDDGTFIKLRPAVNVADELERDRLVKRVRKIRAEAVLSRDTAQHWNARHPNEKPLDTSLEETVIAWCDGRGPLPPEIKERIRG